MDRKPGLSKGIGDSNVSVQTISRLYNNISIIVHIKESPSK
jgi:hypothetical protein